MHSYTTQLLIDLLRRFSASICCHQLCGENWPVLPTAGEVERHIGPSVNSTYPSISLHAFHAQRIACKLGICYGNPAIPRICPSICSSKWPQSHPVEPKRYSSVAVTPKVVAIFWRVHQLHCTLVAQPYWCNIEPIFNQCGTLRIYWPRYNDFILTSCQYRKVVYSRYLAN